MSHDGTVIVFFDYPIKFTTADERSLFDERLLTRLSHYAYAYESDSDDATIVELAERIFEELDTVSVLGEQVVPVFDMLPLDRVIGQILVRLESF